MPPPLRFAVGCAPLCDGSSNSGKRSAGILGRHTGPSGARNMRNSAYKATRRGVHLPEIIQCLCLAGLWQVDQLCLWRRPSESHYQPLSGLSDTQTHIATAAIDVSAKWKELFASLLNVRKFLSVSTAFCQFGHLAWPSLSLSHSVLPSFPFTVCFFILYLHIEFNSLCFSGLNTLYQCVCALHGENVFFFQLTLNISRYILHLI